MVVLSHSLLFPPVLVHLHVQEAQYHPAEIQKSQLAHTHTLTKIYGAEKVLDLNWSEMCVLLTFNPGSPITPGCPSSPGSP